MKSFLTQKSVSVDVFQGFRGSLQGTFEVVPRAEVLSPTSRLG